MTIRHNWARDALATWLTEQGKSPVKEQEIPEWSATMTGGDRAILDLVYQDQQWGRVAVDVTVAETIRGAIIGDDTCTLFGGKPRVRVS